MKPELVKQIALEAEVPPFETFLAAEIEENGLDGLLKHTILACLAMARAKDATAVEAAVKWRARAHDCRAYATMARRVEGRA